VSMFRKSLPSESEGWHKYSVGKSPKVALGISAYAFQPKEGAEIKLHPTRGLDQIRLFYHNPEHKAILQSLVNKKYSHSDILPVSEGILAYDLVAGKDSIRQFKLEVISQRNLIVYGMSAESGPGVYVDNFSIRGNSGLGLSSIADKQFIGFQKWRNYKLVVLQFGLNVAGPTTKDFSIYERNMVKMIQHLKTLFPETTFLLLSTSDRSSKQQGAYHTMPSIPLLVEAQRRIAQQSHILFWDMYRAMGGKNSMVDFVKHTPAWANKDYTHLTFAGGKIVARQLTKVICTEYQAYKKERENENWQVAVQ